MNHLSLKAATKHMIDECAEQRCVPVDVFPFVFTSKRGSRAIFKNVTFFLISVLPGLVNLQPRFCSQLGESPDKAGEKTSPATTRMWLIKLQLFRKILAPTGDFGFSESHHGASILLLLPWEDHRGVLVCFTPSKE